MPDKKIGAASDMTPEEMAQVQAWLAEMPEPDLTDPDNPEWTEEDFARAVRVEDLPEPERLMILRAFPKTRERLRALGRLPPGFDDET